MDYWDVEHTVLRRCKQDLQRETENRRLVRALRGSRKGVARAGRAVEGVLQRRSLVLRELYVVQS
jgi:hypothetical protein